MGTATRKMLSWVLSLSMVLSLVPTPALAEVVDELDAVAGGVSEPLPAADDAAAENASAPEAIGLAASEVPEAADGGELEDQQATGSDGSAVVADSDDAASVSAEAETGASEAEAVPAGANAEPTLAAQAIEDPFYFVDYTTGERVTTLHTTGSYLLVDKNGNRFLGFDPNELRDDLPIWFTPVGRNVRDVSYSISIRTKALGATYDENEELKSVEGFLLEGFAYGEDWPLPSGKYTIGYNDQPGDQFATEYTVVNDGNFKSYVSFKTGKYISADGNLPYFSVKPYTEGATDEQYTGNYYNEEGGYWYAGDSVAEQEPFAPASDVRLMMQIDAAAAIEGGTTPQLESIGLWKADDTEENLVASCSGLSDYYTTRAFVEMAEDPWAECTSQYPSFPTYINFAESYDEKVTTLWERETGEALGERLSDGGMSLIVDKANFSDACLESGLYFPMVRMSYQGETYTFAYYPIEVDATGAAERVDPRITTTSLAKARVGEAYEATLAAKAGARPAGELSWAVTDGALPAGLVLDAASGTISGTPTEDGSFSFAVTLTETAGGEARTATRTYVLEVLDNASGSDAARRLKLGDISYAPSGTIWLENDYLKAEYLNLTIPVSLDVRDYDLGQTELWYLLEMETGDDHGLHYYVFNTKAADVTSADGKTLDVPAIIQAGSRGVWGTKTLKSITAYLVPKTNDGELAFDQGTLTKVYDSNGELIDPEPVGRVLAFRYGGSADRNDYTFVEDEGYSVYPDGTYSTYENLPDQPHATCTDPDVQFGGWVRLPAVDFGEDVVVMDTRITLWSYDGTKATGEAIGADAQGAAGTTYKLAPGDYVFTVEALAPAYDENGNELPDSESWVDIGGKATGATLLKGTSPRQYVFSVGSNEGTQSAPKTIEMTYSKDAIADVNRHSVVPTFEQANGSYASARDAGVYGYVRYKVNWYRRAGADEASDVLVATGDTALFGPSAYDLYVEVVPTGRDAAFWKPVKQKVSEKSKAVSVQVPRKQRFAGTFTLSCTSGEEPAEGAHWGIVEVRTPTNDGGVSTYNLWPTESTVVVSDLTSGATVTFTPATALKGASVSYTVPEDATEDFAQDLKAPLAAGLIEFEGLSFTDVSGTTTGFTLDDGYTGVKVERAYDWDGTMRYIEVPFYMVDGTSILLQPENGAYDAAYFATYDTPTTYRVTVTHRDANAPERMGATAPDYAAKHEFAVTLSSESPAATLEAATLTSRGYALVPMEDAQRAMTALVLFRTTLDEQGEVSAYELVDKAAAGMLGSADELRTPFLDEGTYTLFSAYVDRMGSEIPYDNFVRLDSLATKEGLAARSDFTIEDGQVCDLSDAATTSGTGLWSWYAFTSLGTNAGLVDKTASVVKAELVYSDTVSIQMHAELADGVTLSDDARLEIVTNQASGESGAGYMHPKALTINGKALTLNRWDDSLFGRTRNMSDGNLNVYLAGAKKLGGASCAKFPMDLTLVVPLNNSAGSIEASVWLVDGSKRSLVGSCHEVPNPTDLVVPEYVAWKSFSVYGTTGAGAYVTVFVDGMRAATAKADKFGYWTVGITLPEDVQEGNAFSLTATSQWTDKQTGSLRTATTEAQETTYTELFPVIERITMCYQDQPGETYQSDECYYRGVMPDKYRRLYRSENENTYTSTEHALQFWLVEFANASGVTGVELVVPRESGDITMEATDSLATASSWIVDVRKAQNDGYGYAAGAQIREALASEEPHGFVSKPTYFSTAPADIVVNYDLDYAAIKTTGPGFETVENMGAEAGVYQNWNSAGISDEEAVAYLGAMAEGGHMRLLSAADAQSLLDKVGEGFAEEDLTSAQDMAQSLRSAEAGTADDWMLLGPFETDEGDRSLLLHHKAQVSSVSKATIESEIDGLVADTQTVRELYKGWYEDPQTLGDESCEEEGNLYKDKVMLYAFDSSFEEVDGSSCLYNIATRDAKNQGSVQLETLYKYVIYGTDAQYYYIYQRMDKGQMSLICWDEANERKVEVTYDIAPQQVSAGDVDYYDLYQMWNVILGMLHGGLDDMAGYTADDLYYDPEEDEDSLATQSLGEDEPTLAVQGLIGEIFGWLGGDAAKTAGATAANKMGVKSTDENMKDAAATNQLVNDWEKRAEIASEKGHDGTIIKQAVQTTTRQTVNNIANAAFDSATTGSVFGFGTLFLDFSPTETAIKWWNSGHGWPWSKKKADAQPAKPKQKQPQTEEEWYEEYKKQTIFRKKGLPYTMKRFWGLDKAMLKRFDKRFKKEWAETQKYLSKWYPQHKRVHDPSGVVYEAVLSNPVEGATATLYTYSSAAVTAGLADQGTFVDAELYGIVGENPQVTGADGRYQWFVPEGFWQVRVTKDGYDSFSTGAWGHEEVQPVYDDEGNATSETQTVSVGDYGIGATKDLDGDGKDDAAEYWMPVLPIQLDVNIPLVCREAPVLESVEVDEDGVVVRFSKYLKADSVAAGLFAINGKPATALEALDAEEAGNGCGEVYARTFRLGYPSSVSLVVGDNPLTVTFADAKGQVKSYADVAVSEADRSASFDCTLHLDPISIASANVSVPSKTYTGSAITVTPTVKLGNTTLVAGTDYFVSGNRQTNAGSYTMTITGKGRYNGSKMASYTIAQKANPLAATYVKATQSLTYGTSKQTLGKDAVFKVSGAQGAVSFAKKSGNKNITITSAGTVVVAAKLKVGSYTCVFTATAAGDSNHKKGAKDVTVTIKVNKATPTITIPTNELVTGKTTTIKAVTDGKVTYKSSNKKVATVSAKGVVKGVKAGTVTITVVAKAGTNYKAVSKKTLKVKVGKANLLTAKRKAATVAVAYSKVKSAKRTLASNVTVTKAQGKVTYANASTNATAKKFAVAAGTGKVTVPKGTKKGKYLVVLTVRAAGNSSYISGTKTVKFYVQVK